MPSDLQKALVTLTKAVREKSQGFDAQVAHELLKLRVAFKNLMGMLNPPSDDDGIVGTLGEVVLSLEAVEQAVAVNLWCNADDIRQALGKLAEEMDKLPADASVHQLSDPAVREAVLKLTDGKCAYCGTLIAPGRGHNDVSNFVVEHVVPKSKGGPDNIVNFVPACRGCNNAKGDRHVLHFINTVLPNRIAKAGGGS